MKLSIAKTFVARTALAALAGAFCIAGYAGLRHREYDYAESRQRLGTIGAALTLYRAHQTIKGVADRKTFADAGLPESLIMLTYPGHPWTLIDGLADFRVSHPDRTSDGMDTHFNTIYWPSSFNKTLGDMSAFYASRGERLPIMADPNPNEIEDFLGHPSHLTAVILRLDGTVDVVTYDGTITHDLLTK